MKILKFIGLMILYFSGIIIFATVMALTTLFAYFTLQTMLFGRGNYLLFVSSQINMVPVIMIMILIVYILFQLKERFFKKKEDIIELLEEANNAIGNEQENEILMDSNSDNKLDTFLVKLLNNFLAFDNEMIKIFKIIKICYIPALIIVLYCGMTSYTILYSDSIKISNPAAPFGETYSYSDVRSINVGIGKYKKSYTPYYKITLKNNKIVDLFGGASMDSGNDNHEEIFVNLDNVLKKQGVQKTVDKSNFERFAEGLDKGYVKEVERLFQ